MPLVTPTDITALDGLTPPSSNDPTNFDSRGDNFLGAFPALQTQVNTAADQVYTNSLYAQEKAVEAAAEAASAAADRVAAEAAATSAAQYAGAIVWAAGSYTTGAVAYSPVNGLVYRRKSPGGSSPTDPSLDPTNWTLAIIAAPQYKSETANSFTGVINMHHVLEGVSTQEVVMPTAGLVVGDTLWITVANARDTNYLTVGAVKVNGEVQSGGVFVLDDMFASISARWTGSTYGWSI